MIDITKAKQFYKQYIDRYDIEQQRIALKAAHIYRTAENAKVLAENLKLSEEDILLAELIGLLHDIGRFEQVKRYNTFLDSISVNHAEYGVKVLFQDNLIRRFIENDKYDEIIKKAILNHNKNRIEDGCNERELLHCKIIRDADKIDIYNVILTDALEAAYPLDRYPKDRISEEVIDGFVNNKKIDYSKIKSCVDVLVAQIAYVFDINYLYSLKKIDDEGYLEKIIKKFDSKDEQTIMHLNELKDIAKKYMQDKIKEEIYMPKKLLITEKPSVAMEFSKALKQNTVRKNGYLESEDWIITWCVRTFSNNVLSRSI